MTAAGMLDHWRSNAAWLTINVSDAQSMANQGLFIVAGTSDHVGLVVPGTVEFSGTWNLNVPMIMNTGRYPGVTSQKLSLSWSPYKVPIDSIHFYKYTGY